MAPFLPALAVLLSCVPASGNGKCDEASNLLLLGRALLAEGDGISVAVEHLDLTVAALRDLRWQDQLRRALLARAALHR